MLVVMKMKHEDSEAKPTGNAGNQVAMQCDTVPHRT